MGVEEIVSVAIAFETTGRVKAINQDLRMPPQLPVILGLIYAGVDRKEAGKKEARVPEE